MNASRTPLHDRIAARKGQPIPEPGPDPRRLVITAEPVVRPPWLAYLKARDDTGRLHS